MDIEELEMNFENISVILPVIHISFVLIRVD